ncbi:hypothetical protein ACPCG0_07370 [Propionibacteriaceae bacterium Y1923]
MAQPVGVAVAALAVPALASRWGIQMPLLVAGVLALLLAIACGLGLRDAPIRAVEPSSADLGALAPSPAVMVTNPYRRSWFLARIHAVSALLVIPQFTLPRSRWSGSRPTLGLRDAPIRAVEPSSADLGALAPSPAVMVTDPYRRSWFLARIHAVSALLVIPQFTLPRSRWSGSRPTWAGLPRPPASSWPSPSSPAPPGAS